MVYASSETNQLEIYVRPFPDVGKGRWLVSDSGGEAPLWAPDGKALFYRSGDAVMAVPVETEPTFKAGKPEVLLKGNYVQLSTDDGQPWDISPDGERFIMLKPGDLADGESITQAPQKVSVILNWFEELKQRVPVE